MSQQELLARVVKALTDLGVDYMATGSVVSSSQGEPRASHDIDLVVALPAAAAPSLARAFPPPAYYLSEEAIADALRTGTMFNLLALDEGDKVDFWVLKDEPFDRSRFARKRVEEVWGIKLQVSAPEDTILAKLRWAKEAGGSEKQFTDALRVYEVQRPKLDETYIAHWAAVLGVDPLWEQLKRGAESV
jgi:hypothetical protein